MYNRIRSNITLMAAIQLLSSQTSLYAADQFDCKNGSGTIRFEITEDAANRPRCTNFDPCRQPLFGVTHLHTGLSFDASIRFVDAAEGNDPRGAYQFAQGKSSITLPNLIGIQGITAPDLNLPPDLRKPSIDRPIDWGGVTDHSEHFGEMGICKNFLDPNPSFPLPPGRFSLDCRMINGFYWQPFGGSIDTPLASPFNDLQRNLVTSHYPQVAAARIKSGSG